LKPALPPASLTKGVETKLLAKSVRIALICLGAAICVAPALAQTRAEKRAEANMRSVTGLVTGADDMPAVGAVVQLKDMRTLQVRSFITQANGTYHFYELKMDVDYQLTARSGDTTAPSKTLSVFDSRKEAILNFKLEVKK
jgi:hypothetical protein